MRTFEQEPRMVYGYKAVDGVEIDGDNVTIYTICGGTRLKPSHRTISDLGHESLGAYLKHLRKFNYKEVTPCHVNLKP